MPVNLFALISFVLITTFTPGPANISSASMGILHGYRKTLRFLAGLTAAFFLMLLLSGWLSAVLLRTFPGLETILRYVGAAYILYLAFAILKASYTFETGEVKEMQFLHGFTLNILNPKLIIFTLTLFSAFLAPITDNAALLALALILLTLTGFCATSTWTLFGTVIKNYLRSPRVKLAVNIIMALFLVYTAVELSGIL
jgi:cysteine/O-acetylserine efflux protein